jgi:multicomponent Na+:H+ antiporter subunit D
LNGYSSLGLIHDALTKGHQPGLLAVMLVAQVVTIAALARAAYLAFFRRRDAEYDSFEQLHPGMVTAFVTLGVACIGFGVLPGEVLHHVAAPAAGVLAAGPAYAADVLGGSARIATPHVQFDYFKPTELLLVSGTVLAGLALACAYVRRPAPRPVKWLRALHTGSVNDYAAYLAVGMIATVVVLMAR